MDDDARKALALARKHYDAGNNPTALKWATKSNSIAPSPEAQFLIQKLSSSASASATATATANGATTARQRTAPQPAAAASSSSSSSSAAAHSAPKREFTKEHQEVVLRVRKAGGDYYQVLSCDKSVDESGIKKAYRKLALQLHPDKNAAPGADEAFKLVGKAFAVLSDPDKRAAYDRYGGDPDDARSAAGAQAARAGGGGGGFPAQQFRGGFGDEIDPTEIFNMFFGTGAGMGGVHMNMNGQTFSFGGGGPSAFRAAQFGGNAAGARAGGRRTQHSGQQRERTHQDASIWLQILPLLIIGLFTILTALPSIFLTPDPKFAFAPTGAYRSQRFTPQHGVSYYVDQTAFGRHPFVAENSQSNGGLPGFERRVERSWVGQLEEDCSRRRDSQDRRYQQELGFFGIGANLDLARKIRAEKYESCERLRDWGIVM